MINISKYKGNNNPKNRRTNLPIYNGIYSYKNLITGEVYVGQSHDIEQRFKEHLYHNKSKLDQDIHKYGIENFEVKVEVRDLSEEELDKYEQEYIRKYESDRPGKGYNITHGGKGSINETNPTAKLNAQDVDFIRECYANHMSQKEAYEYVEGKISFGTFQRIFEGKGWPKVHMDVYTKENKAYYKRDGFSFINDNKLNNIFSDDEVLQLRKRYENETAAQIYESVKDRCKFQTLQQILWGRSYSDLPIYDKKKKTWNK